jgi:hypothetical protein
VFSRSSGRHRFEATTGSALNNMRGWHGSKRLSPREALPRASLHYRFWHKTDIVSPALNVRVRGNSGHVLLSFMSTRPSRKPLEIVRSGR